MHNELHPDTLRTYFLGSTMYKIVLLSIEIMIIFNDKIVNGMKEEKFRNLSIILYKICSHYYTLLFTYRLIGYDPEDLIKDFNDN